jgi:hypothetical protein
VQYDEPDPPRKFYKLKEAEFERVNPKPGADDPPSPNDAKSIFRAAAAEKQLGTPPDPQAPAKTNEVHAVLRDNLDRANEAGLNEVSLRPKRPSRRKRDFWTILLAVDGFFLFWAFGPYANAMTFVYGLGGFAMFTTALIWIMWFIMDDY